MRNPICDYCKDKDAFCFVGCKKYKEAQLKRTERRFIKRFGDDYNREDRYIASLIIWWSVAIVIVLLMVGSFIKIIGEWMQ